MPTYLNGFGTAAAVLGPIALLFQLIKIIQKKDANEISWLWIGMEILVSGLWLVYAVRNKLLPIMISSICLIIIGLNLAIFKAIYDKKNKNEVKNIKDLL